MITRVVQYQDILIKYPIDQSDEQKILTICKITKTNENIKSYSSLMPQSILLYTLCKLINAKTFFEIGTGRGTTSLSVALLPHIEKVITTDVLPFEKKRETYLDFKLVTTSNKDFYDIIPFEEKNKVEYLNFVSKYFPKEKYDKYFDISFIDGNHTRDSFIIKDFNLSEFMTKDSGIIVFDDYGPDWAVTRVVDNLIQTRNDLCFTLVNIMDNYPSYGHVIITKKENDIMEQFL